MVDVPMTSLSHRLSPRPSARRTAKGENTVFASAPMATGEVASRGGKSVSGEQFAHDLAFIQIHRLPTDGNLFVRPLNDPPSLPRRLDRLKQERRMAANGRVHPSPTTS